MTRSYLIDGDIVDAADATVDVRDRGFLYGDGAFETMRVYNGTIFAWDRHLDRLQASCDTLGFDIDLDGDQLADDLHRLLTANDLSEAGLRLTVTRGVHAGRIDPSPATSPTIVGYPRPLPRGTQPNGQSWDDPAVAYTVDTRRVPDAAIPASAKTHNFLNGILARGELPPDGDEAIMLDLDDNVSEGATSNVFLVRDGTLVTPRLDGPLLPGITRETVLELARDRGIDTDERIVDRSDLAAAEEAFLTNSTWEIRPITALDGRDLAHGPVTSALEQAFRDDIVAPLYA